MTEHHQDAFEFSYASYYFAKPPNFQLFSRPVLTTGPQISMATSLQYLQMDLTNFDMSESNGEHDCWELCQLCAFRLTDCMCFANTDFSLERLGIDPSFTPSTSISARDQNPLAWETYQTSPTSSHQPSASFWQPSFSTIFGAPAESSWPGSPSQANSGVEVQAVGEGEGSRSSGSSSPEAGSAPRKQRKKRVALSPDDVREKRMQQNRDSQRSFRGRQARLIQNLRQQVQELAEENERLNLELSTKLAALGLSKYPEIEDEDEARDLDLETRKANNREMFY